MDCRNRSPKAKGSFGWKSDGDCHSGTGLQWKPSETAIV